MSDLLDEARATRWTAGLGSFGRPCPWSGRLVAEWNEAGPVRLELDEHGLGIEGLLPSGMPVHVNRQDAGTLVRIVSGDWQRVAGKLAVAGSRRNAVVEMAERRVRVTALPFGMDLAALGYLGREVPLGVLLGTWWPHPEARLTRLRRRRLFSVSSREVEWGLPDLDRYAAWEARRERYDAIESAVFAAASAAFAVVGVALGSSEAWAVTVGGLVFGWRAISKYRHSRRVLRHLTAAMTPASDDGILNRHG